jgi:N-acetylglucosamine-6-phosphate deacetylase
MLARRGIKVAAGHCDPSLDQLNAAIDAGLTHFTHLGNGCPMQMHRHDNIVQRALSLHEKLWLCFIADGAHVYLPALGNYLRSCDLNHVVVVTDAISAAGMGPGRFQLGRWDVQVGKDLVARAPDGSHLVGSACIMPVAVKNLIEKVGLTAAQARKLTVTNPRKSMGMA